MGNISGAPHEVLFSVMNALFTVTKIHFIYINILYIFEIIILFPIYIFLNIIDIQKSNDIFIFVSEANF